MRISADGKHVCAERHAGTRGLFQTRNRKNYQVRELNATLATEEDTMKTLEMPPCPEHQQGGWVYGCLACHPEKESTTMSHTPRSCAECSANRKDYTVDLCPLHAAAPELLEAAKIVLNGGIDAGLGWQETLDRLSSSIANAEAV